MIIIDLESCSRCGLCHEVCVAGVIAKGPKLNAAEEDICFECGHCVAICPDNAITVVGFADGNGMPAESGPPISPNAMRSMLHARRSCRSFKPGPLSDDDLSRLVEAASLAPSSHNSRAITAHVYDDPATLEKIRRRTLNFYRPALLAFRTRSFRTVWKALGLDPHEFFLYRYGLEEVILPERTGDMILYNAPTLILFTAPRFNPMNIGDGWIAAQTAALYAETLGIGTCYNGYVNMAVNMDPILRRIMKIPLRRSVAGVLLAGYPNREYRREAPRKRMPEKRNP